VAILPAKPPGNGSRSVITEATGNSPVVTVQRADGDLREQLRLDALRGLTTRPKVLSPKWFYDERGSALFEAITRLPEYYLTSREREILQQRNAEIAAVTHAQTLIELGSGTSEKTRLLLRSLTRTGELRCFVPFDVDEATLQLSAETLSTSYPDLRIAAVVGDFERDLAFLPSGGRRLIAFLGSTIGNLDPVGRAQFFSNLASQMLPGDALLLGTDLVKDVERLLAAYNDSQGVTAEFNRNVLLFLNRELGADFVPSKFEHVARFDTQHEWIEMILRSSAQQRVRLPKLGIEVLFDEGEEMRTEISTKFRRDTVERELGEANLEVIRWWTDSQGDYALSLSVPRPGRSH
jgi:L-histidine N-alpha-methyltransferase